MRILATSLSFLILTACGDGDSTPNAEVGWSFNYKDTTDSSVKDDIRGCDNKPAVNPGPAYSAISTVTVNVEDPEGQVPGIDHKSFPCEQGIAGARVDLRGIVRQTYALTIEAKTADGTVLYKYFDPEYDLSTERSDTFNLPTVTGELQFFPQFAGSLICPAEVQKLRYALFAKTGGTPAATPTIDRTVQPACEDDPQSGRLSMELFIREVPVSIDPGTTMTYGDFELLLEARNGSDNVVYCKRNPSRGVRLGNNSLGQDESLNAGPCL